MTESASAVGTRSDATPRPSSSPSPLPVFQHRAALYRRTWRGSVFSSFLLPILFLLGMGISVGAYVDAAGVLGIPYLDYIAPGLLASAALQIAIGESTWPVLGGFQWIRTYHAMQASPLRPQDMVGGELLYIWLRVGTSALGFLVVMALFGVVHSWSGVLALPAALLLAVSVSAPVLAYAATIKSDNMFAILFRFAVIPMTLFAGVFFPVDAMPLLARWFAYVSPLWHGVELCRSATLGISTALPAIWHVAYLALWAIVGYRLACWRFQRKLAD
jgi:lipooligosaccharide transport system permease protein